MPTSTAPAGESRVGPGSCRGLRICCVSHSALLWGAERAFLEMVDALTRRGVECFCLVPSRGPLWRELKRRRIPCAVIPYPWWMRSAEAGGPALWRALRIATGPLSFLFRLIANLLIPFWVAAKIRGWGCNVVYTSTLTVCAGALAARWLGLPHVWHLHEFGYQDHGLVFDLGARLSLRLVGQLSSFCVANSQAVARSHAHAISPSKLRVVYCYCAVNLPGPEPPEAAFPSPRQGPIRCVIVARLEPGKRPEDAILAVAALKSRGIPAVLEVVGMGHPWYEKSLLSLVQRHHLQHAVTFLGYREDPSEVMRGADLVLVCSRQEGFGRVVVEAMKLGKPVVGARSGALPELIREGFNGLLYTPGDSRELAEKVQYLAEHPGRARRMGENGRAWALGRFTEERFAREMLEIFNRAALLGDAPFRDSP